MTENLKAFNKFISAAKAFLDDTNLGVENAAFCAELDTAKDIFDITRILSDFAFTELEIIQLALFALAEELSE